MEKEAINRKFNQEQLEISKRSIKVEKEISDKLSELNREKISIEGQKKVVGYDPVKNREDLANVEKQIKELSSKKPEAEAEREYKEAHGGKSLEEVKSSELNATVKKLVYANQTHRDAKLAATLRKLAKGKDEKDQFIDLAKKLYKPEEKGGEEKPKEE